MFPFYVKGMLVASLGKEKILDTQRHMEEHKRIGFCEFASDGCNLLLSLPCIAHVFTIVWPERAFDLLYRCCINTIAIYECYIRVTAEVYTHQILAGTNPSDFGGCSRTRLV
jgi:hypothetical protein